ncbi:allophanate hydrolase subunit 2 [Vibrio ichthyoenteri ATCC 700023]|uniref:Allophanate hydrolase subunit 2 n=1 Tax=Vibrio ichthyoenteri ATCC 700023 TaxID=870968 RepID=F9S684_9VIBR|nr:biotin-dependent carboxyltransferase family protein [Vibrio ichthyoenteri]EGU33922.1 allophanate hydrolase subunit 2 [Vibrio ichthyoenteri ATCC 700023]
MSDKGLVVVKPGALSLIQDLGRFGYAQIGISQGGPLDEYAYSWANFLLGNKVNLPCIEITLGQAEFTLQQDGEFAICGADLKACLDGAPLTNWSTFFARKGQSLSFALPKNGLRCYLAVKGGFSLSPQLGSCASVERDQLGGLKGGKALQENDCIGYPPRRDDQPNKAFQMRQLSFRFIPDYDLPITLRVIEGYQRDSFTRQAMEQFYQHEFEVSANINRMGYRLSGGSVDTPDIAVLSEGIALGAIQIPPDGEPIILLNDRQTVGGYPKIGCVSRVDLPRLAQAKPGQKVRFVKGHLQELQSDWVQWAHYFGY